MLLLHRHHRSSSYYASNTVRIPLIVRNLSLFLISLSFLVIIPAIAQRMVDTTSFPIHSVSIMSPTLNSTVLSLTASIKVPPPFKVRLEPITLQLYRPEAGSDAPYVNFALEQQILKGNTTIKVVNQTVEIADKQEFIEFLRGAVLNEKFVLAAKGETTAHLGSLKAKVKLDKQIELNGERFRSEVSRRYK